MKTRFAHFGVVALLGTFVLALPALAAEVEADRSDVWDKVRTSLFQKRQISTQADHVLELDAPSRAEDAATVPISIKTRVPQTTQEYISKIYLIIDKNPSPIAAVFTFTPMSGRADLETRVRIEEYTHVRAIAEMNNGKLFAVNKFVKAAGGCSAPAGKDQQAALASMGKVKFRLDGEVIDGQPTLAQLMISHPNNSGLAMDQVSRLFTPAHFVRQLEVTYAGKPVMTAEMDFSISENPNFRFYFVPRGDGELKAEIVDSKDLVFENKILVKTAQSSRVNVGKAQ